jgi:hypothetical protein
MQVECGWFGQREKTGPALRSLETLEPLSFAFLSCKAFISPRWFVHFTRKGCNCCPIGTTIDTLIASVHGITSLNRMEQSIDGARKGLLESLKGRDHLGEPDTWRGSGPTTGRVSAGVRSEDFVDPV